MEEKKKVVVDTSVLIENLEGLEQLLYKYQLILPLKVLEEFDIHKDNIKNNYLSFKGRQAIRFINKYYNEIIFDDTEYNDRPDNQIITVAEQYSAAILTFDICMQVKARQKNIEIESLEDKRDCNEYKGYQIIKMTDEELADFYTHKENKWNIKINEYLVIANTEDEIIDKQKWNGETFENVKYKTINNKFIGKIKPINLQQELMFDMLQDNNSKIKLVTGKFGTGKDFCMISHALSLIESNKFDKLVWARSTQTVKDVPDIGFLPGTQTEKLMPFAQVMADHLGGQFGLEMMMRDGKIEIQHLGFIRGRDIKNSIIYISEAENMTKELVQLVMGRVSEGSVLYMNGDFKQVDKEVFRSNSGIRAMVDCLQGEEKFGYIKLEKSERSDVARMADLLD